MSAPGRLWRRAPAWRLSLIAAVTFSALAAMFPTPVPRFLLHYHLPGWLGGHGAAAVPQAGAVARYAPQPDQPPRKYSGIEEPSTGSDRTGTIPFAARQLTLPAGTWQELALARGGGPESVRLTLMGRIENQHATGLLLAAAPDPLSPAPQLITALDPCFDPAAIAEHAVSPEQNHDYAARECWSLTAVDIGNAASVAQLDDVTRSGLARLGRMNVAVAGRQLALTYLRGDSHGWLKVVLLLPDKRGEQQTGDTRLQAWMKLWVAQLHKGFDGTANGMEAVREPG